MEFLEGSTQRTRVNKQQKQEASHSPLAFAGGTSRTPSKSHHLEQYKAPFPSISNIKVSTSTVALSASQTPSPLIRFQPTNQSTFAPLSLTQKQPSTPQQKQNISFQQKQSQQQQQQQQLQQHGQHPGMLSEVEAAQSSITASATTIANQLQNMHRIIYYGKRVFLLNTTLSFGVQGLRQLCAFLALFLPMIFYILFAFQFNRGICTASTNCTAFLFTVITITTAICCTLFLRCGFRDPGFIAIPLTQNQRRTLPTKQEINGESFALRYCTACRIFKPLRAHHCRVCDLCVKERDHHCPFLNNCVGSENRRTYLYFLITAILMEVLILADTATYVIRPLVLGVEFVVLLQRVSFDLAFLQGIYAMIVATNLLSLFLFQLRLAAQNLTTDEFRRIACPNPTREILEIHRAFTKNKSTSQNLRRIFCCKPQQELIYVFFERVSHAYFTRRHVYYETKKLSLLTLSPVIDSVDPPSSLFTSPLTNNRLITTKRTKNQLEENNILRSNQLAIFKHRTTTTTAAETLQQYQQSAQNEKRQRIHMKDDDTTSSFTLAIFSNSIDKPHPTTLKHSEQDGGDFKPSISTNYIENQLNLTQVLGLSEHFMNPVDHLTTQTPADPSNALVQNTEAGSSNNNSNQINNRLKFTRSNSSTKEQPADVSPTSPKKRAGGGIIFGGSRLNLSNLPLSSSHVSVATDISPKFTFANQNLLQSQQQQQQQRRMEPKKQSLSPTTKREQISMNSPAKMRSPAKIQLQQSRGFQKQSEILTNASSELRNSSLQSRTNRHSGEVNRNFNTRNLSYNNNNHHPPVNHSNSQHLNNLTTGSGVVTRQPNRSATTFAGNSSNNVLSRRVELRKRTTVQQNQEVLDSSKLSRLDTSGFGVNDLTNKNIFNSNDYSMLVLDTSIDGFTSFGGNSSTYTQHKVAIQSQVDSPKKRQLDISLRQEAAGAGAEAEKVGEVVGGNINRSLNKGKPLQSHALFSMGHLKSELELRDSTYDQPNQNPFN